MALGVEVGRGPSHIVLDGDPASLPKNGTETSAQGTFNYTVSQLCGKGAEQPHLFGPCLLWPRSPISATAGLLYFIRPHCSTTYVDAAYSYRPSSVHGLSVCLSH